MMLPAGKEDHVHKGARQLAHFVPLGRAIASKENQFSGHIEKEPQWTTERASCCSTLHDDTIIHQKPEVIRCCNHGKAFVDFSDQMAAYCPQARRIVFEILHQ
ncbi:hypothetical protein OSTOST_15534 [Ostertagia ostertagi]